MRCGPEVEASGYLEADHIYTSTLAHHPHLQLHAVAVWHVDRHFIRRPPADIDTVLAECRRGDFRQSSTRSHGDSAAVKVHLYVLAVACIVFSTDTNLADDVKGTVFGVYSSIQCIDTDATIRDEVKVGVGSAVDLVAERAAASIHSEIGDGEKRVTNHGVVTDESYYKNKKNSCNLETG